MHCYCCCTFYLFKFIEKVKLNISCVQNNVSKKIKTLLVLVYTLTSKYFYSYIYAYMILETTDTTLWL